MSASSFVQPDPSVIGGIPTARFAFLPEASRLFSRRALRFAALAAADPALGPYLTFLEGVSAAQARVAEALPAVEPLGFEQRERATAHGMPPIDRGRLADDPAVLSTLGAFFDAAASIPMPDAAATALAGLRTATPDGLATMVANIAADVVPFESLAPHLFVAAGTQIHAARLAGTLDAEALKPLGTGLCPACGGPPSCSTVVGFSGLEGVRYAHCAFCGTAWNEVRIKCLACGSTKGIGYRALPVEGDDATVKAEVCDECRSWLKILYADKNPSLEPVPDDVGTLGLDLLMRDTEYRRAGVNPFLIGY